MFRAPRPDLLKPNQRHAFIARGSVPRPGHECQPSTKPDDQRSPVRHVLALTQTPCCRDGLPEETESCDEVDALDLSDNGRANRNVEIGSGSFSNASEQCLPIGRRQMNHDLSGINGGQCSHLTVQVIANAGPGIDGRSQADIACKNSDVPRSTRDS